MIYWDVVAVAESGVADAPVFSNAVGRGRCARGEALRDAGDPRETSGHERGPASRATRGSVRLVSPLLRKDSDGRRELCSRTVLPVISVDASSLSPHMGPSEVEAAWKRLWRNKSFQRRLRPVHQNYA